MKRTKRRYLAVKIECKVVPSEREAIDAVWTSVTKLFGEVVASLTGLTLINYDQEKSVMVIRTSLATLSALRAALAAITSVANVEAAMHVFAVSGTLKSLFSRSYFDIM